MDKAEMRRLIAQIMDALIEEGNSEDEAIEIITDMCEGG